MGFRGVSLWPVSLCCGAQSSFWAKLSAVGELVSSPWDFWWSPAIFKLLVDRCQSAGFLFQAATVAGVGVIVCQDFPDK